MYELYQKKNAVKLNMNLTTIYEAKHSFTSFIFSDSIHVVSTVVSGLFQYKTEFTHFLWSQSYISALDKNILGQKTQKIA